MINIYTDGACKGNPGPGGWGALIIDGDIENEIYGGENNTTNNRMEIMAVIMALQTVNTKNEITVFTDSTYVQKGINEWINKWKVNGWKASNKKEVKNKDLWVQLDSLVTKLATTKFDLYAPITSSLHSSGIKLLATEVVTWFEPKAILLLH